MLFYLPDLGEGLPDAEIHEWFVKEGDTVEVDQVLASMETAKAVVEIPSPYAGTIKKLYGKAGDVIKTKAPFVEFQSADQGTVVGRLEESTHVSGDNFIVGASSSKKGQATPAIQLLAKKHHVSLDDIQGTGEYGIITKNDIEKASQQREGYEPLKGTRRTMLARMVQSHQEVVSVTIFDAVDIASWPKQSDITVRLIQAIGDAIQKEAALNAWYDGKKQSRKIFSELHLGLAMDSEDGLFVPVILDAHTKNDKQLRQIINQFKSDISSRTIKAENLTGATFTLSNFGKFAGRFANPVIVPPQVAILGVGKIYHEAANENGNIVLHPMLPLSLSFDHRAITGGEATRFLAAIIGFLGK